MNRRSNCLLALCGLLFLVLASGPAFAQSKVDLGIITVKQKDLANQLHAQLVKGASFESLAKANSVGPASFRGGRLGKVPYSRLRSEFRSALKDLPPNKPSKVIPTEEGYTILMRFDQPVSDSAAQASLPAAPGGAKPQGSSFRFTTKTPSLDAQPDLTPRLNSGGFKSSVTPPPPPPKEAAYLAARRQVLAGLEALIAGNLKPAEKHFSKALGENPREDSAQFLLEMTRQAKANKVKPEAVKLFAQGFEAVTQGDGGKALQYFLKCKEADPNFWQGELFAANMMAGMNKRAEAREIILKQVLTRNPKSARAYVTLGLMAADDKQPNQARQYLEKAIALNPDFAHAHYQLGMVALYSQDLQMAERQFKQTITLDPYSDQGYNNLGLIYAFKGNNAEAEKMYKKALALNPQYPDAHVNLGNIYASQGKLNQAIDEYVKAISINPNFGPAFGNMAAAMALKKDWPEAIQAADRALALGHKLPPSLLKVLATHREAKKK
ncbi:MAG: tetratricopeptide repeat protein [Desulfarculaceae bacterium]|nr:tetratricopeptide repeat protein [Desulfarculaceae bacterium]MCF8072305.1 tetratricopeptide repeat protein [Desulfarculaceae bacterium]MCF8100226.1 tetratricopeptide repeat protein [Desulfarculaceae bacterium]MCF8116201.1 tetratricopeptide repeat protein [Desulfarculaceae bacterium]